HFLIYPLWFDGFFIVIRLALQLTFTCGTAGRPGGIFRYLSGCLAFASGIQESLEWRFSVRYHAVVRCTDPADLSWFDIDVDEFSVSPIHIQIAGVTVCPPVAYA